MTTREITVGSRVRLHSGNDVGTVTATYDRSTTSKPYDRRALIQWDNGRTESCTIETLQFVADDFPDTFRGSDDGTIQTIPPR